MSECRYRRLPVWWRQCEAAMRNMKNNERMIRDIESVYAQPGRDPESVRVQGGETDGLAGTVDRKMADRYLCRLQEEVKAIHDTNDYVIGLFGPEDGDRRVRAMQMLYIEHTHQPEGVAQAMHVSLRTVHYYRAQYLWCLARRLGYESDKRRR